MVVTYIGWRRNNGVAIQNKAIEQYFYMALVTMLYKVAQYCVAIQMKAIEQYFRAILKIDAVQGASNFNVCGRNPIV